MKKPFCPSTTRARGLHRGERLANLVAGIEKRALDEGGQRETECRLADRLPEFQQTRHAMFRRITRDDRRVERADGDAGDPVRMNVRLVKPLINARLIGAERAAALQHQRDRLVGRQVDPGLRARFGRS